MFKLICVGQKMPGWVTQGFEEYAKRLPAPYHLQLIEIPLRKRTKNADIVRLQREEGEQMLSHLSLQTHVVALDEHGKLWNTEQLAQQLEVWQQNHAEIGRKSGGFSRKLSDTGATNVGIIAADFTTPIGENCGRRTVISCVVIVASSSVSSRLDYAWKSPSPL